MLKTGGGRDGGKHQRQKSSLGGTVDLGGVLGLLGALMGAAGVPDASPGPLGRGGGSTMGKRGSEGDFLGAMT